MDEYREDLARSDRELYELLRGEELADEELADEELADEEPPADEELADEENRPRHARRKRKASQGPGPLLPVAPQKKPKLSAAQCRVLYEERRRARFKRDQAQRDKRKARDHLKDKLKGGTLPRGPQDVTSLAGYLVLYPYAIMVPAWVAIETTHAMGDQALAGERGVWHAAIDPETASLIDMDKFWTCDKATRCVGQE